MEIIEFLEKRNVKYNNINIYKEAFTHTSYVNESADKIRDYERLEFMGDAVLQLLVSEYIYKLFPNYPEGQLTTLRAKLVREESLARFARSLNFGELMFLGYGEEKNGGRDRDSVLANMFESFVGALYLDAGANYVKELLEEVVYPHIGHLDSVDITDYKTKLQELVQADTRQTVTYELISQSGPSNAPLFEVSAMMGDIRLGYGKGSSKKKAEQRAAQDALAKQSK